MRIDQFHDGHGPHEKEQDAADFLHVVEQSVFKELRQTPMSPGAMVSRKQVVFLGKVRGHVVPSEHEQGPTHGACHQGRGRLVNVNVVLQGDERIPQNEDDENKNVHAECLKARWAGLFAHT